MLTMRAPNFATMTCVGCVCAGRRACRRLLCGLLATYVAQGCPVLLPLLHTSTGRVDTLRCGKEETKRERWAALRQEALKGALRNEHAYKLLWMCEDFDISHRHALGNRLERTTVEPIDTIDGDGIMPSHALLLAAAQKVLRNELTGRSGEEPLWKRDAAAL
jgi:hypothetical protein